MSADTPLTREQLDDGIKRIRHQLELLRSGPTIGGFSDDRSVIAELQAELQALVQARADMK